jgi:hypothetical protein
MKLGVFLFFGCAAGLAALLLGEALSRVAVITILAGLGALAALHTIDRE